MILFFEDWAHYPSAIVDTSTKNKSFLRLSSLYKTMGVKNHTFILSLLNPELRGIDPYDPNLSIEVKAAIIEECKMNFWYYIREVARAPGQGTPEPTEFLANRGNIALYFSFFCHITVMLIQSRQTGKSFGTNCLYIYLENIGLVKTQVCHLTSGDRLRTETMARLKAIQEELPKYMNLKSPNDISNTEKMTISRLGNSLVAMVPSASPKVADTIGRGLSSSVMGFDEPPYCPNIAITYSAAMGAGVAVRDIAEKNGTPYGAILTTTAGKKDDPDGEFIYGMLVESAVWTEKFLDAKNIEHLRKIVRGCSPSGKLRINATFNHRQLGYTDEWLSKVIEMVGSTGMARDRDFFNIWTAGSLTSPLSQKDLDTIKVSENIEPYIDISGDEAYVVRWYVPTEQIEYVMDNRATILSLDTSDASGGDDIGFTIRDVISGEIIAAANINQTNLIAFSKWVLVWLLKYSKITVIIERRSSGAYILDYLADGLLANGINPFRRLYNTIVQNAYDKQDTFALINGPTNRLRDLCTAYKTSFGFATSGGFGTNSRSELYSTTLMNAARYTGDRVRDSVLIKQILSLVTRNGRVDHPIGGKDDLCISWLLSFWILSLGKKLDYYGIDSRTILQDVKNKHSEEGTTNSYMTNKFTKLHKEVEEITERLKKEKDEIMVRKLEQGLRFKLSLLPDNKSGEIISVDDFIAELRDTRRKTNGIRQEKNKTTYGEFSVN